MATMIQQVTLCSPLLAGNIQQLLLLNRSEQNDFAVSFFWVRFQMYCIVDTTFVSCLYVSGIFVIVLIAAMKSMMRVDDLLRLTDITKLVFKVAVTISKNFLFAVWRLPPAVAAMKNQQHSPEKPVDFHLYFCC